VKKAGLLAFALLIVGCAGEPRVVRVFDGHIVEGAYVPPEAYAAYLKGVLAEEAGDLKSALAAYEQAARDDDEDPEPLTRVGDIRCKIDPKNRAADDAFNQALKVDSAYAPALAAQARCSLARGNATEGVATLDKVGAGDRASITFEALFVKIAAQRGGSSGADAKARERAIALTVASGDNPAAWDALIAWGRGKSDAELLARGFEGLARTAPARSREVEAGALELLGIGQTNLARRVAVAVSDASAESGIRNVHDATVARLAIDEALLNGKLDRARVRATRGHVPVAEVAARALMLERTEIAVVLAKEVALADPTSGGAAMVLAAVAAREGRPVSAHLKGSKEAPTDRPPAACVLVLAERLAAMGGGGSTAAAAESARAWAARVGPSPMAAHDPLTGPLAVDLAARGVFAETALPLEWRLELAARRREAPPTIDAQAARDLDPKHMLLWHVLVDPTGAPAKTLLARLAPSAERDPIVGFALVRAALASGAVGAGAVAGASASGAGAGAGASGACASGAGASGAGAGAGASAASASGAAANEPVRRAIASAPAHPLLLAAAVELAKKAGRAEDVTPARTRLMAVARTPAERALAGER